MRIRLTLQPKERECLFPINYQYPLSAAIYKILNTASPEYAVFLHRQGYLSPNGKPLKLFTFSRLWCPNIQRFESSLIVKNYTRCQLLISSPMLEDFIQNFVIGLFEQQEIQIGGPHSVGHFMITQVETLAEPEFKPTMNFSCLSPIVLTTMHEHKGRLTPYYLRPDDARLSQAIRHNLRQKFETIYHRSPEADQIHFSIDETYARRKGGYDKLSKLITIKEGDEAQATKVKCFMTPFSLSGSLELISVAYECGIGDKNSLGFGMIEVVEMSRSEAKIQ